VEGLTVCQNTELNLGCTPCRLVAYEDGVIVSDASNFGGPGCCRFRVAFRKTCDGTGLIQLYELNGEIPLCYLERIRKALVPYLGDDHQIVPSRTVER